MQALHDQGGHSVSNDVREPVTLQKCVKMMEDAGELEAMGYGERAGEMFAEAYRLFMIAQEREVPMMLARHERWEWRAGMAVWALGDDGEHLPEMRRLVWEPHAQWGHWMACDGDAYYQSSMEDHVPVLDDEGTVGCLWGMLTRCLQSDHPTMRAGLDQAGMVTLLESGAKEPSYHGPLAGALLLVWA